MSAHDNSFDDVPPFQPDGDDHGDMKDGASFPPPDEPIMVYCLHCGQSYMSSEMITRLMNLDDPDSGLWWWCATPGCEAGGFGIDVFPCDPKWKDPKGLLHTIEDDDDEGVEPGDTPPAMNGVNGFFHDDGTPMSAEEFFRADRGFEEEEPPSLK